MKRFRVEDNRLEGKGVLYVTLYNPPYEDENILSRTGLKEKDVTITEIHSEGEE